MEELEAEVDGEGRVGEGAGINVEGEGGCWGRGCGWEADLDDGHPDPGAGYGGEDEEVDCFGLEWALDGLMSRTRRMRMLSRAAIIALRKEARAREQTAK
jgi:hypothetical protein